MYNFFVDLTIWSFFIFGVIKFCEEYAIDSICYIINFFAYISIMVKKVVAKFFI